MSDTDIPSEGPSGSDPSIERAVRLMRIFRMLDPVRQQRLLDIARDLAAQAPPPRPR